MGTKFDVEKFTGKNDFGLWRIKMKALLVQNGLQDALHGERKPTGASSEGKASSSMDEKGSKVLCIFRHCQLLGSELQWLWNPKSKTAIWDRNLEMILISYLNTSSIWTPKLMWEFLLKDP